MKEHFGEEYQKIDRGEKASFLTIAETDRPGLYKANERMDIIGDVVGQAKMGIDSEGYLQPDIEVYLSPEKNTLALQIAQEPCPPKL